MLVDIDKYRDLFAEKNIQLHTPKVTQTLQESVLIELAPQFDGWIVGDDPVTESVLKACKEGKTRSIIKWGVGTDNINFDAAKRFNLLIENTPYMFGNEVADIAVHYLIGLTRHTFRIDREVRNGKWPKYQGQSLINKKAGLIFERTG